MSSADVLGIDAGAVGRWFATLGVDDEPRNKAASGTPTAARIDALVEKAHEVADTAGI